MTQLSPPPPPPPHPLGVSITRPDVFGNSLGQTSKRTAQNNLPLIGRRKSPLQHSATAIKGHFIRGPSPGASVRSDSSTYDSSKRQLSYLLLSSLDTKRRCNVNLPFFQTVSLASVAAVHWRSVIGRRKGLARDRRVLGTSSLTGLYINID